MGCQGDEAHKARGSVRLCGHYIPGGFADDEGFLPVEYRFKTCIESFVIPLRIILHLLHFRYCQEEIACSPCKYQRFSGGTQRFHQTVSSGCHATTDVVNLVTQGFQQAEDMFRGHTIRAIIIFKRNGSGMSLTMPQRITIKADN